MNTSKHTPGPWHIDGREIIGERYVASIKDWSTAAERTSYADINARLRGEADANAHLIAAAPAMYEALQSILEFYEWSNSNGAEQAAYDKAMAALAQAEGRHHE